MIIKKREFIPNNLKLRELSSRCIAKYKESQAFALSELSNNPRHSFSTTAKEVLLLNYDTWFIWLVEVEDVLRRHEGGDSVAKIIMQVSDHLEEEYSNILREYKEVFNEEFILVWLDAHKFMYAYLREKIKTLTSKSLPEFMLIVTDTLISVMDNTLFELHEIDNLFLGNTIFLSFDDICIDYQKVVGDNHCILGKRLEVYAKYFKELPKEVIIKDYSKHGVMLHDLKEAKLVFKSMQALGYKIKRIE